MADQKIAELKRIAKSVPAWSQHDFKVWGKDSWESAAAYALEENEWDEFEYMLDRCDEVERESREESRRLGDNYADWCHDNRVSDMLAGRD